MTKAQDNVIKKSPQSRNWNALKGWESGEEAKWQKTEKMLKEKEIGDRIK